MTFLFFESVSCQSTFICSSASRASLMPLKKSLLLAASPVSALFKSFATRWTDFQNGLFFGFFGSRSLSARAFLIIAAEQTVLEIGPSGREGFEERRNR